MSFKDISLGRYVYGTSLVHRLDPRTKLVCLPVIMCVLFAGDGWPVLVVAGLYIFFACALSGLAPSYLVRSFLPFKWLIIITVVLNILFVGGLILVRVPLLPYGGITQEGLNAGGLFGARIALLVLAASLLTLTTEPVVLVEGVEKMLAPLKRFGVKPHEVAIAMVITIRFIPVLLDEAEKISKSHRARGFKPESGFRSRLKSASIVLLPLFSSAIRRAENLAVAMDCRLYRSDAGRTHYKEIRMKNRDWAALFVTVVFVVGVMSVKVFA